MKTKIMILMSVLIIIFLILYMGFKNSEIQKAKQELLEVKTLLQEEAEPSKIEKLSEEYKINFKISEQAKKIIDEENRKYQNAIWENRCIEKQIEVLNKDLKINFSCNENLEQWANYNLQDTFLKLGLE